MNTTVFLSFCVWLCTKCLLHYGGQPKPPSMILRDVDPALSIIIGTKTELMGSLTIKHSSYQYLLVSLNRLRPADRWLCSLQWTHVSKQAVLYVLTSYTTHHFLFVPSSAPPSRTLMCNPPPHCSSFLRPLKQDQNFATERIKLDEVPVRSFLLLCHFFCIEKKKEKPEITHTREETEIYWQEQKLKKRDVSKKPAKFLRKRRRQ